MHFCQGSNKIFTPSRCGAAWQKTRNNFQAAEPLETSLAAGDASFPAAAEQGAVVFFEAASPEVQTQLPENPAKSLKRCGCVLQSFESTVQTCRVAMQTRPLFFWSDFNSRALKLFTLKALQKL